MAKPTKRNLRHPIKGKVPFDNDHADRIMSVPENDRGGWEEVPKTKKGGGGSTTNEDAVNDATSTGDSKREADGKPSGDSEGDKTTGSSSAT